MQNKQNTKKEQGQIFLTFRAVKSWNIFQIEAVELLNLNAFSSELGGFQRQYDKPVFEMKHDKNC